MLHVRDAVAEDGENTVACLLVTGHELGLCQVVKNPAGGTAVRQTLGVAVQMREAMHEMVEDGTVIDIGRNAEATTREEQKQVSSALVKWRHGHPHDVMVERQEEAGGSPCRQTVSAQ